VHLNDPFSDTCAVATESLVVESAPVKFVVAHACDAVRVFSRCVLTTPFAFFRFTTARRFRLGASLSPEWRATHLCGRWGPRAAVPSTRHHGHGNDREKVIHPMNHEQCLALPKRAHAPTHAPTRTSWRGARKRQCKKPTAMRNKHVLHNPSKPLRGQLRATLHIVNTRAWPKMRPKFLCPFPLPFRCTQAHEPFFFFWFSWGPTMQCRQRVFFVTDRWDCSLPPARSCPLGRHLHHAFPTLYRESACASTLWGVLPGHARAMPPFSP
jgi:hypothetical protein